MVLKGPVPNLKHQEVPSFFIEVFGILPKRTGG